jgi:hypothetical protein
MMSRICQRGKRIARRLCFLRGSSSPRGKRFALRLYCPLGKRSPRSKARCRWRLKGPLWRRTCPRGKR